MYRQTMDSIGFYFLILMLMSSFSVKHDSIASELPENSYTNAFYFFPWPPYELNAPWRSGLANGEAMNVLVDAYHLTKNYTYFSTAERLLNSFFVDTDNGGVTYKIPGVGWWYELFASEGGKQPRVLNGMSQTLLELYDYYNKTGDTKAKFLFEQGLAGLKANIHTFDYENGSYTWYDTCCGNLSPIEYHEIVITSLSGLYNITQDGVIGEYHNRWKSFTIPPIVKNISHERPHLIYDEGVPILDYNVVEGIYIGLQRNPLTVAHYAEDYLLNYTQTGDEQWKEYFLSSADWLLESTKPTNSSYFTRINFPP